MAEFDKSIFMKQFQEEASEHLQFLDQGLLALEKEPRNRQVLDQVFRSAHTLKGTSSMLGFHTIKDLAHAMEDILHKAREGEIVLQPDQMDVLFDSLDALKSMVAEAVAGKDPLKREEQLEKLRKLTSGESVQAPAQADQAVSKAEREKEVPLKKSKASQEEKKETSSGVHQPVKAVAGESIRVEVNRLDTLLNLTGELTISRSRLYEILRELRRISPLLERVDELMLVAKESEKRMGKETEEMTSAQEEYRVVKEKLSEYIDKLFEAQGRVDRYAAQIQEGVMQIRMLPISTIFATFPRIVRDACRQTDKKVNLSLHGSDTELDKRIIDEIGEPLMHLLRNGVDHGIELPEKRREMGKPAEGKLAVHAYPRGNQVIIEVEDDGKGIDKEKVKQKALDQKLITEEEALSLEQQESIFSFLFLSGFSTKDEATALSGRGVGLDVVKDKIERMKGSIQLVSKVGEGSRFTIRLPLTLSLTEVIMVKEGGHSFAIPIANIEEMVLVRESQIQDVSDKQAVPVRGELIPLVKLGRMLLLEARPAPTPFFPVVVIGEGEKKIGIWVDELKGKQEIVIKSFGSFYPKVENFAGATILGSGEIVPILDVVQLAQNARRVELKAKGTTALPAKVAKKRIMVVEDSLVTREAERSILEFAGYEVITAVDGKEAQEKLQQEEVDLVVSDIEMPRMDGFALLSYIRSTESTAQLPVIIVTTRDSQEDRAKGIQLGADRYVVKGEFQQEELLGSIKSLIG